MKLSSYPHLVKEWHPTMNGDLTPDNLTHGSGKKAWWLCPNGHNYETNITSRTARKQGCPYCSGNKVGEDNNLLILFPKVGKDWHPTNNGELTPKQVTSRSSKKVWWLCNKGHSYESVISSRTGTKPQGCPYCSGKRVSKENNLFIVFPLIAKEWHPTKNKELTPKQITTGSGKKVWWLCPKGHSYEASINSRARQKTGCSYCAGKKVGVDNSLQTLFPEIAKEWHPTKNGELNPNKIASKSQKKVWWLCLKGHSYNSVIANRTSNLTGCPNCSNQSSEPEIRILSELKWFFDEVKSRYKVDGVEIDIFLPKFNLGIEYDGYHWHKNKVDKDLGKNKFLLSQDINLIRVRSHPLRALTKNDLVVINTTLEKIDLDELLKKIHPFVDENIQKKIKKYYVKSSFVNEELFKVYRSYFPSPFPENSLLKTNPLISKEWDYDKNSPLRPENFSLGSHALAWWLCSQGHSYKSNISTRAKKNPSGCPYCSNKKVGKDNNLQILFPNIAKEWHPTKNSKLIPKEIVYGSKDKAWWLCPKGHSYSSIIASRTGKSKRGCPYCSGNRVGEDNNLLVMFPKIAKEWHPTKNGKLTPDKVAAGSSSKKVWWLCSKDHSYQSKPNSRTSKQSTGCPYCSNRKVSEDNNLLIVFPEIAKEWHPTMNGKITSKEVVFGSRKKAWWLCPKGHSYESSIQSRVYQKSGCSYCDGKKVSKENSLQTLFPAVSKEWHPTKNKKLTAKQVTAGSGKVVWWLCPKGHSYEKIVRNRTRRTSGCPECPIHRASSSNKLQ